jgi:hypothetical protein
VGKRVEQVWHEDSDKFQSKYATLHLSDESN